MPRRPIPATANLAAGDVLAALTGSKPLDPVSVPLPPVVTGYHPSHGPYQCALCGTVVADHLCLDHYHGDTRWHCGPFCEPCQGQHF